jgi:ribose/xylose/arabinose/galactoside ABC-type transport system permease subunit
MLRAIMVSLVLVITTITNMKAAMLMAALTKIMTRMKAIMVIMTKMQAIIVTMAKMMMLRDRHIQMIQTRKKKS